VILQRQRIRLKLETTKPLDANAILDAFLSEKVVGAFGRAWQVEIGLFDNDVLAVLTGIISITMEIKSQANGVIDTGAALLSKTIGSGTFNQLLSADQWENDSGEPSYHAMFDFLDTDIAALSMLGEVSNQKDFGLVFTAIGAYGRFPLSRGIITIEKDGGTGAGSGVAPVASYTFSDQELLAMFAGKLNNGVNPPGVGFTLVADNDATKGLKQRATVPLGEADPIIETNTVNL
jgi:hypothetical protein